MKLKLFGDTTPIPWEDIGVKMPFAPLHKLAQKYESELVKPEPFRITGYSLVDFKHIFEASDWFTTDQEYQIIQRVEYRTANTIAALDQCTPDTICLNIGGGYHHAGKTPKTGYAYSLINDIIWAVDYQLDKGHAVHIIDLDFHFGGGTIKEYVHNQLIRIDDIHNPKGYLYEHQKRYPGERNHLDVTTNIQPWKQADKVLVNLGTDWLETDPLFGKFNTTHRLLLIDFWTRTINNLLAVNKPLAITLGGGYGEECLELYDALIAWLRTL